MRIHNCPQCHKDFRAVKKSRIYCSNSCSALARPRIKGHNGGTFKSGLAPWNKGMLGYRAGHHHSPETIEKIRKANSGENAPNWKGGVCEENYRIRRTRPYALWRKAVFERDDYRCVQCGDRSAKGHRVEIQADHILPFASHPDLRFDVSNGRTLCVSCHRLTPTWGFKGETFRALEASRPASK